MGEVVHGTTARCECVISVRLLKLRPKPFEIYGSDLLFLSVSVRFSTSHT